VVLHSNLERAVTVKWRTVDATAQSSNNDYIKEEQQAVFLRGSKRGDYILSWENIVGDNTPENHEWFFVKIVKSAEYGIVKGKGKFLVVIRNDD
jgi:hypothetical protein